MSEKQRELLKSQTNAEEVNNSSSLIEYEMMDGTPFTICRRENNYYVMLGEHRLNDIELFSSEEVVEYVIRNNFMLCLKMCTIVAERIFNSKN